MLLVGMPGRGEAQLDSVMQRSGNPLSHAMHAHVTPVSYVALFCTLTLPFSALQFETRKYRKVVSASTPSADEMHWMLEHLKLFEFTGVQIKVCVWWWGGRGHWML